MFSAVLLPKMFVYAEKLPQMLAAHVECGLNEVLPYN